MGKVKPFIDKKKSSTYHLLHRSQRDIALDVLEEGDVGAAGMVLWPDANNNPETDKAVLQTDKSGSIMKEWRERLAQAGLLDEQEERERYLKPISWTGTFLDASGRVSNPTADLRMLHVEEEALLEVGHQFDSIPLNADAMDEDINEALFGDFEEGEYEELNDDFVLQAASEPEGQGDNSFDFDEHIRNLMQKAKQEREGAPIQPKTHDWGRNDHEFFSGMKPLHESDENDDDSWRDITVATVPGVVPSLNPEEERALCEKFEETLLEYDSDEVGDCLEEEIAGLRPLEGDAQIEAALDDYLAEKQDEIFIKGKRYMEKRTGGSGFSALSGKKMVPADQLADSEDFGAPPESIYQILDEANERLSQPIAPVPPEEILIDGKSYFSERERNPWDCESVLSTYSNLDNNPVTIEATRRRKKKTNRSVIPIEEEETDQLVPQIRLSNKTGLPLGVLPSRQKDVDFDDTIVSVNKGEARKKNESSEERRQRKATAKMDRKIARIQKKVTREIYQEEFEKRTGDLLSDPVGGKTVFRFS